MLIFRLIFIIILVFLYSSITFSQYNIATRPNLKIDNRHYALSEDQAKEIYNSKFFDSFDYLEGKQYQPYNIFGHSTPFLDGEYTVFGEIVEGLEVLDKIANVEVGEHNRPKVNLKMKMKIISE